MEKINRAFLIVLDSVGIGGAVDAKDFGDDNPNTLNRRVEEVSHAQLSSARLVQYRWH